jgi:predicted nucleic acid-binding Zn ribbon protein
MMGRGVVTEIATAAGCSRQLVSKLLARGLTREEIIARIANNRLQKTSPGIRIVENHGGQLKVLTDEGLSFVADALLSETADNEIAKTLGVSRPILRRILRETIELAPYLQQRGDLSKKRRCIQCGNAMPFKRRPQATFCCIECRKAHTSEQQRLARVERRKNRHCAHCGSEIPDNRDFRSKYCSNECRKALTSEQYRLARLARLGNRYCSRCGREIPENRSVKANYCSDECREKTNLSKRPKNRVNVKRWVLSGEYGEGVVVVAIRIREWPACTVKLLTKEGFKFVAAALLTPTTYPEIAEALGIDFCTFKLLVRQTPELAQYRQEHHRIVSHPEVAQERDSTCKHCGETYRQRRNNQGNWSDRKWCYRCEVENRTPLPPEERRKRLRDHYQSHRETEQKRFRDHYDNNREKEIDRVRRYKVIRRYSVDRDQWREQWKALQNRRRDDPLGHVLVRLKILRNKADAIERMEYLAEEERTQRLTVE